MRVRRDEGLAFGSFKTFSDDKLVLPKRGNDRLADGRDFRQGGRLVSKRPQERLDLLRLSLHLDRHALRVIEHPAAELAPLRQLKDEGAKADALHHAATSRRFRIRSRVSIKSFLVPRSSSKRPTQNRIISQPRISRQCGRDLRDSPVLAGPLLPEDVDHVRRGYGHEVVGEREPASAGMVPEHVVCERVAEAVQPNAVNLLIVQDCADRAGDLIALDLVLQRMLLHRAGIPGYLRRLLGVPLDGFGKFLHHTISPQNGAVKRYIPGKRQAITVIRLCLNSQQ